MNGSLDDEQILDQFREWMRQSRAEADDLAEADESQEPDFGLYRFAEEFTAMRHELKLQTRSSRTLEERTETVLAAFGEAIEMLRSAAPKETSNSSAKSFALGLAELDEALDRGREQWEKAIARLNIAQSQELLDQLEELYAGQSWLRRWLTSAIHQQTCQLIRQGGDNSQRDRQAFAALLDGYSLMQQRLRRLMSNEGIMRMMTVGQPVDPDLMVVVEVIDEEGIPGTVADEARRGYTWNGQVLRYAEVRAIRPRI